MNDINGIKKKPNIITINPINTVKNNPYRIPMLISDCFKIYNYLYHNHIKISNNINSHFLQTVDIVGYIIVTFILIDYYQI